VKRNHKLFYRREAKNIKKINKESKLVRFIITITIASIGGALFNFIHMPIPWLLGPMVAVLLGSSGKRSLVYWPICMRDIGMVIVGYSIGLSFTREAQIQIFYQLPSIILMTVTLVLFSTAIAFLISKLSGIDFPTILTGSIPGGLSQMIMLAEEIKGINITIVTFLQVARLMMIIFVVPIIIFNPLFGVGKNGITSSITAQSGVVAWDDLWPNVFLFAGFSVLCALIGKKIKLPTAVLVGPILGIAILNTAGIVGPLLPSFVLDLSQVMIGSYIGLLLKPQNLPHKGKVFLIALVSSAFLMLGSFGLSLILEVTHGFSFATSYLSLAPGGMDQMGIIAHEVNADLSMVAGYQLFRLFFIFFVVPPMLKWVFRRIIKKSPKRCGINSDKSSK
jgi:uncharacterized protein